MLSHFSLQVLHDVTKEMHLSPDRAEQNEKGASFVETRRDALSTHEESEKSCSCLSFLTKPSFSRLNDSANASLKVATVIDIASGLFILRRFGFKFG